MKPALRRRSERLSLVLSGFVIGALMAGLVVPFVVGDSESSEVAVTGSGDGTPWEDGDADGDGVQDVPAGDTASTGPGASPGSGGSGGSSGGSGGGGEGGGGGSGGGGPTGGGDDSSLPVQRGVTSTEIVAGIPIVNTSEVGGTAGVQIEGAPDQRAMWQAYIDLLNAQPIHGRKIRPVYVNYNALDPADARRACNELTEDHKVFVVLAYSFYADAGTCVTAQHKTILLNAEAHHESAFRQSAGRLFTLMHTAERTLRIQAHELHRLGMLDGKNLGVLTSEGGNDHIPTRAALLPTLQRLGQNVVHTTTLAADFGVAQSQIPLEVAEMRRKDVKAVFLPTNGLHVARFSQEADRQGFRPTYFASDFAGSVQEYLTNTHPDSFEGVAVTSRRYGEQRTGAPEAAKDAACRQTFEASSRTTYARGSSNYQLVMLFCSTALDLLRPGLVGAGRPLTTSSFTAALQRAGTFEQAFGARSSLAPGKFDAADFIRVVRFRNDCKCWVPIDEFRAPPA